MSTQYDLEDSNLFALHFDSWYTSPISCKRVNSSENIVQTNIFYILTICCDLDCEYSNLTISQETLSWWYTSKLGLVVNEPYFRRSNRNTLIIWAFTVATTLKLLPPPPTFFFFGGGGGGVFFCLFVLLDTAWRSHSSQDIIQTN